MIIMIIVSTILSRYFYPYERLLGGLEKSLTALGHLWEPPETYTFTIHTHMAVISQMRSLANRGKRMEGDQPSNILLETDRKALQICHD